jgi:ABC-type multidrug transport system ATPase subunit
MTGGNELAIAAAGLTKRYGTTAALCDVSLQARAGTVTALLGPNGAGKTTMIRILSRARHGWAAMTSRVTRNASAGASG